MRLFLFIFFSAILSLALAGPIDGLQPGTWYEVPNSHLRSVVPSPAPTGNLTAITDAWSGGAYDTDREQLIVWGGGHVDYAGNEVYTFGPMNSNSPAWTRRTNPSTSDGDCGASYGDGKPTSTHTYGVLAYAANVQRFFAMGLGSNYPCGSENSQVWSMDMTNNTWDPMSTNPSIGTGGVQGAFSAYDEKTGYVWTRPAHNENLKIYNPPAHAFLAGNFPDGLVLKMEMTGAIDPLRRVMVGIGGYGGGQATRGWFLDSAGKGFTPTTTGDKTPESGDSRGFQFHPPSGLFVAWFGGATVYTLKLPQNLKSDPWVWTRVAPASGNTVIPTGEAASGTYGRFRYCPGPDVFVCVNSIDQNVFVYKLNYVKASVSGAVAAPKLPGLLSVSPNPCKTAAVFTYHLQVRQMVELAIFNAKGERVATLLNGGQGAGLHRVTWARPNLGAGLFAARIKTGNTMSYSKFFILK